MRDGLHLKFSEFINLSEFPARRLNLSRHGLRFVNLPQKRRNKHLMELL